MSADGLGARWLKYARIERERRFRLAALPSEFDPSAPHTEIADVYFAGTSLRLRTAVDRPSGAVLRKLTQKSVPDPSRPFEARITNTYLDESEAALLAGLPGVLLRKRRFELRFDGAAAALDVFEGRLAGLVLIEVACDAEGRCPVPDGATDVTSEARYRGGTLATTAAQPS